MQIQFALFPSVLIEPFNHSRSLVIQDACYLEFRLPLVNLFETAGQIARGIAQLALYYLPDDYFSEFAPSVRRVEAEAVLHAAWHHLDPDRLLTVIVGDRERVSPALDRAGLGPVTHLTLD